MDVKKVYPELYKEINKHFPARKTRTLLKELVEDCGHVSNTSELNGAFVWADSRHGHKFWMDLYYGQNKTTEDKPSNS